MGYLTINHSILSLYLHSFLFQAAISSDCMHVIALLIGCLVKKSKRRKQCQVSIGFIASNMTVIHVRLTWLANRIRADLNWNTTGYSVLLSREQRAANGTTGAESMQSKLKGIFHCSSIKQTSVFYCPWTLRSATVYLFIHSFVRWLILFCLKRTSLV